MQNEELNALMKEFDRNYAWYYTDIGKEQGLEDEVIAKPPEIKNLIIKAYHTGQTAERERIVKIIDRNVVIDKIGESKKLGLLGAYNTALQDILNHLNEE